MIAGDVRIDPRLPAVHGAGAVNPGSNPEIFRRDPGRIRADQESKPIPRASRSFSQGPRRPSLRSPARSRRERVVAGGIRTAAASPGRYLPGSLATA